jgi:uncharacterized SAM-binding protein YcdF (DUF218 family)
MAAGSTASYVLAHLALPPTVLLLTALAGSLYARRRPMAGGTIAVASVAALLLLSTTWVAQILIRSVEPLPLTAGQRSGAQAIVILGGGRVHASPEFGGDTVSFSTLRRLRYGAILARETNLPVLVSGGNPDRAEQPEARLMQVALERDFGVQARWVEDGSDTTLDNARLSAALLAPTGIRNVLLVTDAYHMNRSMQAFEAAGLAPIAAPTGYADRRAFHAQHLVPNVDALRISNLALREWAAGLWYRLNRWTPM